MEVREACSSVTSDVRDMLVCLVTSSRRKELEQKDSPEEEATLAEVRFDLGPSLKGLFHCLKKDDPKRDESPKRCRIYLAVEGR